MYQKVMINNVECWANPMDSDVLKIAARSQNTKALRAEGVVMRARNPRLGIEDQVWAHTHVPAKYNGWEFQLVVVPVKWRKELQVFKPMGSWHKCDGTLVEEPKPVEEEKKVEEVKEVIPQYTNGWEDVAHSDSGKCMGVTKSGKRCSKNAVDGSNFCKTHTPKEG